MPNQKYLLNRRRFLATTAAATGAIAMPSILRAQGAPVKLGVLHPVTGALSYSGQQGRLGATLAIEEINAAGGIKGLGKIDPVLGDESQPKVGDGVMGVNHYPVHIEQNRGVGHDRVLL